MIVPTKFIVSIYKNILRLESGTIIRKNLIIVPFFLILRHAKSTQPCMIQVLKQKSKECALCLKIIPSAKQLYHEM